MTAGLLLLAAFALLTLGWCAGWVCRGQECVHVHRVAANRRPPAVPVTRQANGRELVRPRVLGEVERR